jgi:hypothetical protein
VEKNEIRLASRLSSFAPMVLVGLVLVVLGSRSVLQAAGPTQAVYNTPILVTTIYTPDCVQFTNTCSALSMPVFRNSAAEWASSVGSSPGCLTKDSSCATAGIAAVSSTVGDTSGGMDGMGS